MNNQTTTNDLALFASLALFYIEEAGDTDLTEAQYEKVAHCAEHTLSMLKQNNQDLLNLAISYVDKYIESEFTNTEEVK